MTIMSSLGSFTQGQPLPDAVRPDLSHGALVMTFDDSHTARWLAAAPMLAEHAARATFFITGPDRLDPRQIEDLKALRQMGHAIGCHGWRHAKAVDFVATCGMDAYLAKEIKPACDALAAMGFTPTAFAYPSSQNDSATDAALLEHFRYLRTGGVVVPPELALKDVDAAFVPVAKIAETRCLKGVGIDYLGVTGRKRPVEQILEALDRARERKEILVLYAHNIGDTGPGHHVTLDALRRVLAHAQAIGLPAVTYDDLPSHEDKGNPSMKTTENMKSTSNYRLQHEWARRGFDGKTCWVHAKAGVIPAGLWTPTSGPVAVMTMQPLQLSGSDLFSGLSDMWSEDRGATWSPLRDCSSTLGRRPTTHGLEEVICDATPAWHAASQKLLLTGHVARYKGDALASGIIGRAVTYSSFDLESRTWAPWKTLEMPDSEKEFFDVGAGCTQRFDLENGDILLPAYHGPRNAATFRTTVLRCRFDGDTLTYVEHGTSLETPEPRGLYEPSLTRFQGRFFLTLRNDRRGYVAVGDDGLHFEPAKPWLFDDGSPLGSYNTQQHWITHGDALFLVYTRSGLNNDHVFRNRAPLVMAQVDPVRLCVIRGTERVLVPERGARLGNFAVTQMDENETWATVCEWMQNGLPWARNMMEKLDRIEPEAQKIPSSPSHYAAEVSCFGSDNTTWIARLLWAPSR